MAGDRASAFVVAVGDAEGVGRRAVADDLAVESWRLGALACSSSSSTSMPAPSPRMKPSRSRSNGRLALVGSSLRVDSAVSRLKPVTPNGWIMLCVPPESITSASPRRIISVGFADRLRAGRAGGEAVGVRPLGAEDAGQVRRRGPRLLLGLADRVQLLDARDVRTHRFAPVVAVLGLRAPSSRTGRSPAAPRPSPGRRRTGIGRALGLRASPDIVHAPSGPAARANGVFR